MHAIEARSLRKHFGDFEAVRGIDFEVVRGETYGLLGPNGAGKTTTMRMLAGLSPITSGSLHVDGLDVSRHGRSVRQKLGVVTQADGLDGDLTVRDNLIVYGELMGLGGAIAKRRADEVLEFFLLADRAGSDVGDLSGGMKRRLAIARALLAKPSVIVLDEPSTGLDPESRMRVWEELAALKAEGVTLLMSTHYMDEAEVLCDRIAMMHGGRILDIGTPAELVARNAGPPVLEVRSRPEDRAAIREVLKDMNIAWREMGALLRVPFSDAVADRLSALADVSVTRRQADLEDVFLNIAGTGLSDA